MNKPLFALLVIFLIGVGAYIVYQKQIATVEEINRVLYLCDSDKTIEAAYYRDKIEAENEWVSLVLSDGRKMKLPHVVSASGIRYANNDESFIFWSKGNGAFILENDEQTFANCVATTKDPGGLPLVYVNGNKGFSIRYPENWSIDENYSYQALGPGKDIAGVKFTIPSSLREGTNLSSDTGLSVEIIPQHQECEAGLFVLSDKASEIVSENGTTYSVIEIADAGAGNFYEEKVWALPGIISCTAIRYLIHSTNIGNYPEGAVREFDREALINEFDKIRKTILIVP